MTIITSTINAEVSIEVLENFLIMIIDNWFGDDEVIFQNDDATCQKAKGIRAFLWEINYLDNEQFDSKSKSKLKEWFTRTFCPQKDLLITIR